MWEIWAKQLLPRALKSCPKSNKSPNLVTLLRGVNPSCIPYESIYWRGLLSKQLWRHLWPEALPRDDRAVRELRSGYFRPNISTPVKEILNLLAAAAAAGGKRVELKSCYFLLYDKIINFPMPKNSNISSKLLILCRIRL